MIRGEPTTLYHGTTKLFRKFDLSLVKEELGRALRLNHHFGWVLGNRLPFLGFYPNHSGQTFMAVDFFDVVDVRVKSDTRVV